MEKITDENIRAVMVELAIRSALKRRKRLGEKAYSAYMKEVSLKGAEARRKKRNVVK